MTERTLVILRHAKAERPGAVPDHERRLSARGEADAGAAGAWLAATGRYPDLVLCSSAARTRGTWQRVAAALGGAGTVDVRYEPALYSGGTAELVDLLRQVPPGTGTVLLIGHNPVLSQLSALLDPAGTGDPDGLATSGLAVHAVTGGWAGLGPGGAAWRDGHTARG